MKKKTKQIDELEYKHNLTKYYAPMGTLNELLNKLRETLIPRTWTMPVLLHLTGFFFAYHVYRMQSTRRLGHFL